MWGKCGGVFRLRFQCRHPAVQLNTGMRYREIVAEDAAHSAATTPAVKAADAARKRSDAAKKYQDTLAAAREKNAAASRTRASAVRTYQNAMRAAQ